MFNKETKEVKTGDQFVELSKILNAVWKVWA